VLTEVAVIRAVHEPRARALGRRWMADGVAGGTRPARYGPCRSAGRHQAGGGSSKPHTARYGQPFTTAQVRVHVGEGVLTATKVVAAGKAQAAVAFPDTPRHRAQAGPVESVLHRLGVTVYWVREDSSVISGEFSAQLG
jgi:hypothetical protein